MKWKKSVVKLRILRQKDGRQSLEIQCWTDEKNRMAVHHQLSPRSTPDKARFQRSWRVTHAASGLGVFTAPMSANKANKDLAFLAAELFMESADVDGVPEEAWITDNEDRVRELLRPSYLKVMELLFK